MLRELEDLEVSAVSGGDIVVNGSRSSPLFFSMGSGYGFGPDAGYSPIFQDIDQIEARRQNLVDTDGDGVPDSPEIVVIANKVQLEGGYYAYIANGQYVMHFDGWFSDHYVGTFVPGTEHNHNLVTKDPIFKLFGEWRGVKIGGETQPNAGEYWTRVQ